MDRVSIKNHAKKSIEGKIFNLLAIYIIVALVSGAIGALLAPLAGIAVLVISGPIAYADAYIFLGITRKDRTPKIEDLLLGFKDDNFSRNFIAYLRQVIFTFLWGLLFWIPGIIKGISYSQMFYLLNENKKMDAAEAQKKSMEMMEGHKMDYFVLQLSFIPWYLLVGITFGIAAIYVTPYVSAAKAEFHNRLVKEDSPIEKIAKVAEEVKEKVTKKTKTNLT